jgi:hypothetical protein
MSASATAAPAPAKARAIASPMPPQAPVTMDVMYADAPYTVIRRAVHIHPTVAELIPTMLADLKPLE